MQQNSMFERLQGFHNNDIDHPIVYYIGEVDQIKFSHENSLSISSIQNQILDFDDIKNTRRKSKKKNVKRPNQFLKR